MDPTRAARLQRDAGLERGRSISKGVALASMAAVVVGGVYFSQALPGRSAPAGGTTAGAGGVAAAAVPANSPAGGGATSSAPSAPASTPAPAFQAPVVSSGAS